MVTFVCLQPADAPTLDLYGYYKFATYINQTPNGFTAIVDASTRIDLTGSDLAYQEGYPIAGTTSSAALYKDGSPAYYMSNFSISMGQAATYILQPPLEVNKAVFSGDDTIVGSAFDDVLGSWGGNDTLSGGQGNDTILGGTGRDTVVFIGKISDYNIESRAGNNSQIEYIVSDKISGRDGNDILRGVEVANFADGSTDLTVDPHAAAFGYVAKDVGSSGSQVYALYEGILGRAPDTLGLEYYADQIAHGVAPASLAANFLASPEGQARLGAADNTAFVQQLYQNTLGRAADSAGLQYHLDELARGVSRVDVANSFVFSPEHSTNLQPAFDAGVFVPDAQAAQVARVYYTMLGRAPDANGLAYWTDQLDYGGTPTSIAQGFLNSPENQATYGQLSNSAYVDALYVNALGRHAESDGLSYWTEKLDHGVSRADLAASLSQSPEAQNLHLADIEQGWHLA